MSSPWGEKRGWRVLFQGKRNLPTRFGDNYRRKNANRNAITRGEKANFGMHMMWPLASQRGRSHRK